MKYKWCIIIHIHICTRIQSCTDIYVCMCVCISRETFYNQTHMYLNCMHVCVYSERKILLWDIYASENICTYLCVWEGESECPYYMIKYLDQYTCSSEINSWNNAHITILSTFIYPYIWLMNSFFFYFYTNKLLTGNQRQTKICTSAFTWINKIIQIRTLIWTC